MYERRDFTRVLPSNLTERIFSFLSPQDLSRCAQVSSHWKTLSERDDVWKPKCLKLGWYLPYEPAHREVGAWKAHYVECVCSIHARPLSKVSSVTLQSSKTNKQPLIPYLFFDDNRVRLLNIETVYIIES